MTGHGSFANVGQQRGTTILTRARASIYNHITYLYIWRSQARRRCRCFLRAANFGTGPTATARTSHPWRRVEFWVEWNPRNWCTGWRIAWRVRTACLRSKRIVIDPLAFWMPREFVNTIYIREFDRRRYTICASCTDGITNCQLYFRRYISMMYNPSWYGN